MKERIILAIVSLLTLGLQVSAEDKLTINGFAISPGETKSLNIELENEADYAGFQFDLYLPEGIVVTEYSIDNARVPESASLTMARQEDGGYRFIAAAVDQQSIKGNSGSIISIKVTANKNMEDGRRIGYFRNVKLAKAEGKGAVYDEMSFPILVFGSSSMGDANGDGTINAEDIVEVVNYLRGYMSGKFMEVLADANGDGIVNTADIVQIVNIIMGNTEPGWIYVGTGTITDNFWFESSAAVTILKNIKNPYVFRIMAPFDGLAKAADIELDGNQNPYIELTLLKPGDIFDDVEITRQNLVGFTKVCTGYYYTGYDDIYMLFPSYFSSLRNEKGYAYNRVVEWQENGLPGRIQLAPNFYIFGVGGWDKTQDNDIVIIDFPGYIYSPKDLTASIEYLGVQTDAAGSANVTVNLSFGADVTDARAVVVRDDTDDEAIADAIAAGEVEAVQVSEGGNQLIPIEEGLIGKLKVVLVILDKGMVKNTSFVRFDYYGGVNPWETVGIGEYIYTLFFGLEEEPVQKAGLELQYNVYDDDYYRITHWGNDVDFNFTLDSKTFKVNVPAQFTGYTHSSYGDVSVGEADDYNSSFDDGSSYFDFETLTFHFHVVYFASAGYFGHGEETFTLTPAQARRLGIDKNMPKVNDYNSLKPVLNNSHVHNNVVMSRE